MSAEQPASNTEKVAAATQQERRADAVRQIVTRRERAPRSPAMERALKRIIWRYTSGQGTGANSQDGESRPRESLHVQE